MSVYLNKPCEILRNHSIAPNLRGREGRIIQIIRNEQGTLCRVQFDNLETDSGAWNEEMWVPLRQLKIYELCKEV